MVVQAAPTVIEVPTVIQQAPVVIQQTPVVIQQAPVVTQPATAVLVPTQPSASNNLSPQEAETLRQLLQKSSQSVVAQSNTAAVVQPAATTKASRVTVILPAEARLWVDNVECPLASSVRSFNTPPLNMNQQYYYNLKVELAREGRNISETQRVLITPGQEVRVDFNTVGALRTVAR